MYALRPRRIGKRLGIRKSFSKTKKLRSMSKATVSAAARAHFAAGVVINNACGDNAESEQTVYDRFTRSFNKGSPKSISVSPENRHCLSALPPCTSCSCRYKHFLPDRTKPKQTNTSKIGRQIARRRQIASHIIMNTDNAIQSRTGKIRREKQRELSQTFKLWAISSLILNKTYTQDYDRYACP